MKQKADVYLRDQTLINVCKYIIHWYSRVENQYTYYHTYLYMLSQALIFQIRTTLYSQDIIKQCKE